MSFVLGIMYVLVLVLVQSLSKLNTLDLSLVLDHKCFGQDFFGHDFIGENDFDLTFLNKNNDNDNNQNNNFNGF